MLYALGAKEISFGQMYCCCFGGLVGVELISGFQISNSTAKASS